MTARAIASLVAATLALAACDNKPTGEVTQAPPPAPARVVAATQPPPATPAQTPAPPPPSATMVVPLGTSLAVYTVDSLVVGRPDDAPKAVVIKASGSVRTGGWTEPKLEEMPDTADASVKSYRFVATSPTAEANTQALQTVDADLRVDSLPAKVTTIRVVSETNEISASVEQ